MTDEFDIIPTGSENHFYRDEKDITVNDFIAGIDNVLNEIEKTGDMGIGLNVAKSLVSSVMAHGKSLAKLLHGMSKLWQSISDKDFISYTAEFTGLQAITISRYIDAWEGYLTIPEEYQEKFLTRPMKDLNAIGAAIAQGFVIEDWDKLANASNNAALLKSIREDVKQAPPRKNSLTIGMEDTGDLVAYMGGKSMVIGYLDIENQDPIVKKSVKRIIESAGIIVRED